MYLQLKDLVKEFEEKKAVDNLSLSIEKGEILCLLGPSGCGKTTVLKIIGGFLKADNGKVIIEGEDISVLPPEKRPVSTVFQSYALFPHLNVIENVTYGLKFQGYNKREALKKGEEYLKIVGLEAYENKKIHELSGGQQQRVALARALIINPKVLLLDEPLSNLDAKLRIKVREEIKEVQRKFNITMVFVTHDQEEALSMGDKIAVMNNGKIEQLGTAEDIYLNPKNSFVLDFIGSSNIIKEKNEKTKFIRPEHISIHREKGDLKGEIILKTFMGSYYLYVVRVGEDNIKVKETNLHNESFKEGEEVYLNILKEGVIEV